MGILSDAPKGFSEAVSDINSLPQGLLVEMVSATVSLSKRCPLLSSDCAVSESRRHSILEISSRIHSN